MRAEQVTAPIAHHGEGPVWLEGCGWPDGLSWVDMLAGDVLHLDPAGAVHRRHVSNVVALLRPRIAGGLVYAVERGFALDRGAGTELSLLAELWNDPGIRLNEGGCDPVGNLYCGSMSYSAEPGKGSVYRLEPDGAVHITEVGWTIPNGLAWTADGKRAYHCDTIRRRVDVLSWDLESGLHDRRPFVVIDGDGFPDGLTVDAEGGVWVALWGGRAVHRYSPEGARTEVVTVSVEQPSACTFGGPHLDQLFITTSRHDLPDPEPAAGALFVADVGVRGLPALPFAG